ncbi:MAG: ABC transporter ATP-binding protein [Rhizobiaceae bacterium]|nr:ABC transporter ATP-binding protein [Rhizobiaceae bacterium]
MTDVDINAVAKSFGATPVLSGITAQFGEGSFTSLLGPSGSGKTTLLRIVAGFVAPDEGRVSIGGRDVTGTPVWARNIGMVFQSYALFPHMSVSDNVGFGLARRGIKGGAAKREIEAALELVRLPGYGARRPKELSGGQQQRVALARAIVTKPSVLLLDEPLSALDRRLRQEMQVELVRIQRASGLTTIFVTHDQEEALTLSDRVAILDRGRIVQIGAPAEIYERPKTRFAAEFLGDINLFEGIAAGGDWVALADGRLIACTGVLPPDGIRVTAAVRPEKIAIVSGDKAIREMGRDAGGEASREAANRLEATIASVVYAGAALTYKAEAAGRTVTIFAQNSDARPHAVGDAVTLVWSPGHTVLVEEDRP